MRKHSGENSQLAKTLLYVVLITVFASVYTLYKVLEPPSLEDIVDKQAYVSLISSPKDVIGIRVLGQSLKDSGTSRSMVVMVPDGAIGKEDMDVLRMAGYSIENVKRVTRQSVNEIEGNLTTSYTKTLVWQLPFEKVVYLDPDCVVLQNIDELFDIKAPFAAVADCCDMFNAGVFMTQPSKKIVTNMLQKVMRLEESTREDDFLNAYFPNWQSLPFRYNAQQHHLKNLSPRLWKVDQYKVIHYSSVRPWSLNGAESFSMDNIKELSEHWWYFHNRLPVFVNN